MRNAELYNLLKALQKHGSIMKNHMRRKYYNMLIILICIFSSCHHENVYLTERTNSIIRLYIKNYEQKCYGPANGIVMDVYSDSLHYYLSVYGNNIEIPICGENYWGTTIIDGYNVYVFGEQSDFFFHPLSGSHLKKCPKNMYDGFYDPLKWVIAIHKRDTSLCQMRTTKENLSDPIQDIEQEWYYCHHR